MNARSALRAALRQASPDWRPVLLAELLAEELRRAHASGALDSRVAEAVNAHLGAAADAMYRTEERTVTDLGDEVVVQGPDGQHRGRVAAAFATTLVLDTGLHVPRLAVLANLTLRPEPAAGGAL